jgi:hypothetical protein
LQLRVLRFGFLQDGNIRVGVFPQREEIFVGGAGKAEMGERPEGKVKHDSTMVQYLLKLCGSLLAFAGVGQLFQSVGDAGLALVCATPPKAVRS